MSRVARTMLIGIAASVAVLTFAVGLVYVNIMGGFDDLLNGDRPQETDVEVVAARTRASGDLEISGAALSQQAASSTSGDLLASGEIRRPCDVGEHNWKVDNPYDLMCDLARLQVVGSSSVGGFRDHMVALDAALAADGWQPAGRGGLQRVLTDYWDDRTGLGRTHGVDFLPTASYSRRSGDEVRRLEIQWATARSRTDAITYEENSLALEWSDGSAASIPAVLGAIAPEGYAVVLTEWVTYFDE